MSLAEGMGVRLSTDHAYTPLEVCQGRHESWIGEASEYFEVDMLEAE